MKGIKAGSIGCRLFLRTTDGDNAVGYSPHCYTQEQAENSYGDQWGEGVYVSGYFCDRCGGSGFPNATPCAN